jgi:ATP-dependent 26S proteasome regulatory subunit
VSKTSTKFGKAAAPANVTDAELNLRYLHAEMSRIDVLVRSAVARWQQAGRDPNDAFRGLVVGPAEVEGLLAQPAGGSWGDLAANGTDPATQMALATAAVQAQELVEAAAGQGVRLRLHYLAQAFGLTPFEVDALLVCLAPALDLRYEQIFSFLQNDVNRKRPTVSLVLHLLAGSGMDRLTRLKHFVPDAPLLRHRLLDYAQEPGLPSSSLLAQPLAVERTIVNWLLGDARPNPELGLHARLEQEMIPDEVLLGTETREVLQQAATLAQPLVLFHGQDQAAQEAAARLFAAYLGRKLFVADISMLLEQNAPDLALRLVLRDARLNDAIVYIMGWDACLHEHATPLHLLQTLLDYPDTTIVSSRAGWQAQGATRQRPVVALEFGMPSYAQRQVLWRHYLRAYGALEAGLDAAGSNPAAFNPVGLDPVELAGQFTLQTGQIRDAVATARDRALQRGEAVVREDLFAAARIHSCARLGEMARKITPRYAWDDIILPDDQIQILRELVATVRGRSLVLDEWGLRRKLASSAAVTVLFAGPPGTGKTMAAEVIALDLGLDLYKIDLSGLVSKYIGETEKNLERVFTEAESSNAILFFDEADAIFGKRSGVKDAHDRYANLEISYLLQRMEAYDGVTILATNLRSNLDEAFLRRLQFAVDIPFPDEKHRLRIWETLFPAGVPRGDDVALADLARRYRIAGGNIRNVLLGAAFLAAADGGIITMRHLQHAMRRELQKMGRLLLDSQGQPD